MLRVTALLCSFEARGRNLPANVNFTNSNNCQRKQLSLNISSLLFVSVIKLWDWLGNRVQHAEEKRRKERSVLQFPRATEQTNQNCTVEGVSRKGRHSHDPPSAAAAAAVFHRPKEDEQPNNRSSFLSAEDDFSLLAGRAPFVALRRANVPSSRSIIPLRRHQFLSLRRILRGRTRNVRC